MAGKVKVTVVDAQTLKYPDGHVETCSAHPMSAPPDDDSAWIPALGRFMPQDEADYSFEAEVDDD